MYNQKHTVAILESVGALGKHSLGAPRTSFSSPRTADSTPPERTEATKLKIRSCISRRTVHGGALRGFPDMFWQYIKRCFMLSLLWTFLIYLLWGPPFWSGAPSSCMPCLFARCAPSGTTERTVSGTGKHSNVM